MAHLQGPLSEGNKKLRILLLGLNYSPELTGIGKYSGEMMSWFSGCSHHTTVITTPPYYPEWKVHEGFSNVGYSVEKSTNSTIIRCPFYVPVKPTAIKRLLHLFSFSVSAFFPLMKRLFGKPDVIVTVQPTFFCAPFVLLYAKLTRAKAVMHIQDFELDAMLGLGMFKDGCLANLARWVEGFFLKRFDMVSTISFSMMENAARKGVSKDKLCFFPNWADTDFVTPEVSGDALRQQWGFSSDDKVVLYAGNIGKKQGLEIVLDAAEQLRERTDVKFVLVGSGAHVDTLKEDASARGLKNLYFKPLQPWERVPEMLAMADLHLVVQLKGAADVVLPSKLTNILSAGGHALVTSEQHTELGKLAQRFNGIYQCVEPEDSKQFFSALRNALENPEKLRACNTIARQYAVEYLNKEKVLRRFEQGLKILCGQEGNTELKEITND